MFDPFGINNHINSILNNMLSDPFMAPQHRQMNRQQQMGGSGNMQQHHGNNGPSGLSSGGPSSHQLQVHRSGLFNNDPFSIVQQHHNHHNHHHTSPFDRHLVNPFNHHHSAHAANSNPFALMNHMMSNMDNLFRNLEHNGGGGVGGGNHANVITADPNSHVFSSSSVITYSSADGKPKIFQQSKQVRQGPGGVKETREMVRDSEKGIEQMAIGHHIGERAHVIERKKGRDGNIEEVVNLENLDDEEVGEFNKEFEQRIGAQYRSQGGHHNHHHRTHHLNNNHPLPIEDGSRSRKEKERKNKSKH